MAKASEKKETQSAMDYAEHERTYSAFLWVTKWTIVTVAAILLSMLTGFFGGFGLWAILVFAVLMLIAYFAV